MGINTYKNILLLDFNYLSPFGCILVCCYVVVLINIAGLIPHLFELFITVIANRPYALPKSLVTFSILFYPLLYLSLVRSRHTVRFQRCILGGRVLQLAVWVGWG